MPWEAKDSKRFTKATKTPSQRKSWSKVANGVLRSSGDEGKAIRVANSKFGRGK